MVFISLLFQVPVTMDKLIIFTSGVPFVPTVLTEATLEAVRCRDDVEITSICVPDYPKLHDIMCRRALIVVSRKIKSFFDSSQKRKYATPWPIKLHGLGRQHNVEVLVPPHQDINHPRFVEQLKTVVKPTMALSYYCLQRFSPGLLDAFEYAANYHSGLLPKYKGLRATCWSVYHGEKQTGFTFHRMSKDFDEGAILLQGTVPVRSDDSILDLEFEKAIAAKKCIPRLIEMMVNREAGQAQTGEGSYFSKKDLLEVTRVDEPSRHSSTELMKRLRAFGFLNIKINGRWYMVTKLETMSAPPQGRERLCFRASNGSIMRPTRFQYLPLGIYRVLRWIERLLPSRHRRRDMS
jgi:methionyl-tRNA formyltransferase